MDNWLIGAAELKQLLEETKPTEAAYPIIFDCRFSLADYGMGKALYQDSHIPGAFHLDMEKDLSGDKGQHGGRHPVPSAEDFTACTQRYGVNRDSLIIAYDNNRLAGSARLWWLLSYYGHNKLGNNKVKVLDGGFSAWESAGYSLSKEASPIPSTGDFNAVPSPKMLVDQSWVKQYKDTPEVTLIDAREEARYKGLEEPIDPIAGHIPSAINSPWQRVTDEQGFVRPADQQRQLWQSLELADNPVAYCGSGVTACVNLFSMALAGIENTRLYGGSWSDWCSYPENPVASS